MRPVRLLLLLLLGLLLSCASDSSDQDESAIRDIIYDISRDFSWGEIEGIMDRVHPDYLHRGMYEYNFRALWQQRLGLYDLLSCEVSSVEVEGDYAVVRMEMTFQSADETLSYPEPETWGDISYFHYDFGQWLLYGNQLYQSASLP